MEDYKGKPINLGKIKINVDEFTIQYCTQKVLFLNIMKYKKLYKINEETIYLDAKERLTKLEESTLISSKARKLKIEC